MLLFFNEPWNQKSEEARRFAAQHYFNVVSDIMVELKVKK
jgi:tRNA G46 methylase TrmB